jgi:SAM-dependent methyltransferase
MAAAEPHGRPSAAGIDTEYLRNHQYKDPTNLHARVALHAKHTEAEQPWFEWVAGQIDWPPGADVLEVGCGSGLLWANIAPLLGDLHLTLTDISDGMLDAARRAVAPFANVDLVDARTADVQELPFDDESFDVVVANHMLYHVPDRPRAMHELARVLRPDGILMAATNGARHLEQVSKASREVFGWATMDFVDRRFGRSTGADLLHGSFADVEWRAYQSALVCDEPEDVYNFIASSSAMQRATAPEMQALRDVIRRMFDEGDGVFRSPTDTGCFLARRPLRSGSRTSARPQEDK